ncbi:MAG: UDP-N-acetylmuramoyl-tripeptide--D-alanyl-D-alanine ligase [Clostridium sp.]|nr:UDP-N-acetylmuramoyl-tripeptide--D-alanyl-D-alanine ligase [Clostridium sp.]MCM1444355.1 UDP-N-acetylmuramoyl-tripeptide--D-alanyl-D-alanine ligase [Candidatus Amulumruptor caecigallinarius]
MIYFLISIIPMFIYMLIKSTKGLHSLQQNWYNDGNRYIKWINNNLSKVFLSFDMLFLIVIAVGFLGNYILQYVLWIILYIISIFVIIRKKEQVKLPLKYTSRIKRLLVTIILIYLIPIFLICIFYNEYSLNIYYIILGILVYFSYYIVILANIINKPIEKIVYFYYKNMASKKLSQLSNMQVVGITGSYGKTSSKNILSNILNVKYNALPTPKNFNTLYGLMRTINENLDKFTDIFIAEMGAFRRGEIKKLCNFVHPKYGIITTIGEAHLETFGSRDNICIGKFELVESLPSDGVAILNGDDPYQLNYKIKNNCKVLWIGINNKDVDLYASDIKITSNGMQFKAHFKGDKNVYEFETKLLGKANIYNILAGIILGKYLNLSIEELQRAVKGVIPVEHRLELKYFGNINIIDDAYNSNPVGSKMALDVLNLMNGKKIIVTPGMIELGDKQYEVNKQFGKYISEVCDEVILVGEQQTKPIYDGLVEEKYDTKKIHVLNDVKKAFPLIQSLAEVNTYVLLENDLPDIFNEKE